ncbi:reverse transcriptase domain-containing protein [Tanacetum coccineum]|uniref:Reverse transcriptase domain-containing protein n=1 Tax=Tanacetum coccineum TaxID=301880 RepID=A0ABQ4YAT3_9ASTR
MRSTRFQQRFDESFYEALGSFNDILRACPLLGFSELHQLDTFIIALHIKWSGNSPGNTITNPREDLKGITTRSGVAYRGPPIPTSSVVKPIPEVTKDQVAPSCSQYIGKAFTLILPTCMTLELSDRSISTNTMGIAKDISVKVGVFHFPADFVVVDFDPDPRVPLILGRCFLKTSRALIDVHKGELTLRIGSEAITYNLDQTSRYSARPITQHDWQTD